MGWITGLIVLISTGGAGFIWTFERHVPSFRQHLPDRIHKLIYSSLIFAVLYALPIYLVYTYYVSPGNLLPWWIWLGLIIAIILPPILGEIVGIYWDNIRSCWELILYKVFKHKPERRPYIPTGFDYVIRSLVNRRKLRPLVFIRFTDTAGDRPYLAIGHLRHASSTPYPQDIYLNPIYFLGPEKEISRENAILDKQNAGCLISYKDVVYTKIFLFEPQIDSPDTVNNP